MNKTHILTDPGHIAAGLRHPDLAQALYDEGAVIMKNTLLTLHGDEHRKRRLLEFKVFRKDFFRWYEKNIFHQTLAETIKRYLAAGNADLVDLGYRVTMNLTADFAGVDRPEKSPEETDELRRLVTIFSEGATLVHSTRNKDDVRAEVRAALADFEPRFLAPSITKRRALLEAVKKGEISEEDLPRDVLTVILQNGDPEEFTPELLTREIAFYLQAGSHSTANSTAHSFHDICTWAGQDGKRWKRLREDPLFLQRCVHESLRLHPASPVAWRKAMCPLSLEGAGEVENGAMVEFRLYVANRDPSVFGEDADEFNPERQVAKGNPPFGHTFGTGTHTCLGRDLDGGVLPRETTDPDTHQYGIITQFIRTLFAHGAQPDPNNPPSMADYTARPNWGHYPIVFDRKHAWL